MIDIWLSFLTGLTGSLHCLGMCGGVISALAMSSRQYSPAVGRRFQLFYNLGRISTYTVLGALAGLLGASLDLVAVRNLSLWFLAVANLLVICIGIGSIFALSLINLASLDTAGARSFTAPLRWALAGEGASRGYPLGLILGFLPCGLVYAPLAVAAGSGEILKGASIMAAMGFGTLPVLLLFGMGAHSFSSRLRELFVRLTGFFLLLLGGSGLCRVLTKLGYLPPLPFGI